MGKVTGRGGLVNEAARVGSRVRVAFGWVVRAFLRRRIVRVVLTFLSGLTPLAWGLLVTGAAFVAVGVLMGWPELAIPGGGALAVVAAAVLLSFRRYQARVAVEVSHERVTVGDVVTGQISLRPSGRQAIPSLQILVPIGDARVSLWSPRLAAGDVFDEPFILSTAVRGRITVGPAQAVRADALGVVRRVQDESEAVDVYVHPRTVPIASQVLGFIKDLEGVVTQDLSSSDVSFRALRDYVPGDDRRSIHWKTSARVDRLMVRQFEETRRAHLLLIVDCAVESWSDAEEFEQGVSAAASLVRAASAQSIRVDLYLPSGLVQSGNAMRMLDELAVVQMDADTLSVRELTTRAVGASPQASVVAIVSGSGRGTEHLTAALYAPTHDMKALAIRMNAQENVGILSFGCGLIVEIPSVDHLPRSLNRVFA